MHFVLDYCTDADMPRAFELVSVAFGHEYPYIEYLFPNHSTPKGRKHGGERFKAMNDADPCAHFLKVTDVDTGVMLAMAKWNIYDGVIPEVKTEPLKGDYWACEEDRDLANDMYTNFIVPRMTAIRENGGRLLLLDILCVDPKYQRNGAGRMLVRWGTEIADRKRFGSVVEASPQGRGLYISEGFQVVDKDYRVELSKRFAHKETQSFIWMTRPRRHQNGA